MNLNSPPSEATETVSSSNGETPERHRWQRSVRGFIPCVESPATCPKTGVVTSGGRWDIEYITYYVLMLVDVRSMAKKKNAEANPIHSVTWLRALAPARVRQETWNTNSSNLGSWCSGFWVANEDHIFQCIRHTSFTPRSDLHLGFNARSLYTS